MFWGREEQIKASVRYVILHFEKKGNRKIEMKEDNQICRESERDLYIESRKMTYREEIRHRERESDRE